MAFEAIHGAYRFPFYFLRLSCSWHIRVSERAFSDRALFPRLDVLKLLDFIHFDLLVALVCGFLTARLPSLRSSFATPSTLSGQSALLQHSTHGV